MRRRGCAGQSGKGDVGREISHDELVKYAPALSSAVAAFETPRRM